MSSRVSLRYLDEAQRPAGAGAPTIRRRSRPMRRSAGPSRPIPRTPNQLAPEGERVAPPAPGPQQPFDAPGVRRAALPTACASSIARSTSVPIASALLVFGGGTSADPAARPGVASMMANLVDNGAGRHDRAADRRPDRIAGRADRRLGQSGQQLRLRRRADREYRSRGRAARSGGARAAPSPRRSWSASGAARSTSSASICAIPRFVAQRVACRAVYGDAPYGSPPGGTPASLAALTRDDLVAYHRAWWRPDNATLVITGSMDAEAGFALAERLFGQWAAPAAADAAHARQPRRRRRRRRG